MLHPREGTRLTSSWSALLFFPFWENEHRCTDPTEEPHHWINSPSIIDPIPSGPHPWHARNGTPHLVPSRTRRHFSRNRPRQGDFNARRGSQMDRRCEIAESAGSRDSIAS
jgi:hypothetical protein